MDNASKALIMAGAILISVAIVGIGIYIFTTANGLTESAVSSIDSLEVSTLNSNITKYCGTNVRGSSVKQLINDVNVWNAQGVYPHKITITGASISTDKNGKVTIPSSLTDAGRYSVQVATKDGYDSLGYIQSVTVAEVK